jgi:putative acetyltransferase
MLKIRKIESGDNVVLTYIIREVLASFGAVGEGYAYADWSTEHMFEAYCAPGRMYWVVEEDGEVKGGGGFAELEGESDVCEIQKMYFLPEIRGKGMGKAIMDRALREAKKYGYKRAYLETLPNMNVAKGVYEKCGFIYLNGRLGKTGHHKCHVWMLKEL